MAIFIGDVHGKWKQYSRLLKHAPESTIQVGDLGVGFLRLHGVNAGREYSNPPYDNMKKGGHRFIRGNHDNPAACRRHSQHIPDGHVEDLDGRTTMFVGGAESYDKQYRIKDFNWWEDEELSLAEWSSVLKTYGETQPKIMVSHDGPVSVVTPIAARFGLKRDQGSSRTQVYLEQLLWQHRPELWVFGHWHVSFDETIRGTRFVCLAELEGKEL